jgi:putative Mg2+ transporter-C (MgtC) family protein
VDLLFSNYQQELSILLKLGFAMLLSALIGLEREAANKPAGLRTHILVGGAATLLVSLGHVAIEGQIQRFGSPVVQADPLRIVEPVIVGISFLGAGTILRDRSKGNVEGLTTAASLLFVAVVGMEVAFSQGLTAVGATLIALIVLRGLPWIERRIQNDEG